MDTLDQHDSESKNTLTPLMRAELRATAPWIKLVGIGWICYAVLYSFYASLFLRAGDIVAFAGGIILFVSLILLLIAAMYTGYGSSLKKAIDANDPLLLEKAFRRQKNALIVMGVVMILMLIMLLISSLSMFNSADEVIESLSNPATRRR